MEIDHEIISTVFLLPSADAFKKSCCQLQAKVCARIEVHVHLGPSINGLVTDLKAKLCCRGFILTLFQSTTANKIDSEHTRDYKKLLPICEAEILRVTVKLIEVFSSFYVDL